MSGLPPCRRCVEQQLECVLAKSRRGGRRIKGVRNSAIQPAKRDSQRGANSDTQGPPSTAHEDDESDDHSRQSSDSRPSHQPGGIQGWPSSPQHTGNWRADSPDGGCAPEMARSRTSSDGLEGHIASTDLLNPSDALDLLAQVADLAPDPQRNAIAGQASADIRHVDGMQQIVGRPAASYYPPLDDGILTHSEATYLLKRYVPKDEPHRQASLPNLVRHQGITRNTTLSSQSHMAKFSGAAQFQNGPRRNLIF